mmetsp:Transcript_32306/g.66199  ORF Transcript_32306/g.66199 Transcript_32306/m.66199 type:complete len:346 (+) Transcript_32306:86-1123(+)
MSVVNKNAHQQAMKRRKMLNFLNRNPLFSSFLLLGAAVFVPNHVDGFVPVPDNHRIVVPATSAGKEDLFVNNIAIAAPSSFHTTHFYSGNKQSTGVIARAKINGESESEKPGSFEDLAINPPYAIAYVLFLGYAFMRTMGEAEGASMEVLQGFFNDPLNPGCNEIFTTIFNLLGLFFVPMACLLMPGAKGQKFPATPFLAGAALGGYGVLGPYAITRKPMTDITKADLGWFTANVLENKVFNYFIAAAFFSAYITSGLLDALLTKDVHEIISGYLDLVSSTAIASASSMDFLILTVAGASFVSEDVKRRNVDDEKTANLIGATTMLLPGIGLALYCALRPNLNEQ